MIDADNGAETTTTTGPEQGPSRDELLAAYRGAVGGGEEEAKPPAPEAEAKPPAPADAKPAEPEPEAEPDAKGIAKILKQREKANDAREEARKAAEEAKAAVAEAKEARETAAAMKKEAEAFLQTLRRDPIAAIRAAGWDPDELVLNLRDSGTPGASAQREQLALKQELAELRDALKQREAREREAEERRGQETARARAHEAEQGFLKVALDAEKFPALSHVYGKRPHLLVAEATRVAETYHARTGQYATWNEIAEYLDSDHSDLKLPTQPNGQRDASPAERAPGSRTLTAEAASERRSAPVLEWDEMTDEQRRAAQIADMRAAIRQQR